MLKKNRGRTDRRAARPTLYGNPKQKGDDAMTKTTKTDPALTPQHEEVTPYGALKYRKPVSAKEFTGTQGTRPEAAVLDIDGTLTDWGSAVNKTTLEWVEKQHKAGRVLIVITARTHEHDYARSFDWLVAHLPYPFIGPIHRSVDDPRFASEFKRETIEVLAQLYDIKAAADDNVYVLDMYKHYFGDDFDLLECGYGRYEDWRKDLKPARSYGTTSWTPAGSTLGKTWVSGSWDATTKTWVPGHYEDSTKDEAQSLDDDPSWKAYLDTKYADTPERGDDEFDDLALLSDNDRIAMEDAVLASTGMDLPDIEKLSDAELMELAAPEERIARITNRLDLEESVYANYPDMGFAEIQDMDIEDLRLLAEVPPTGASGVA